MPKQTTPRRDSRRAAPCCSAGDNSFTSVLWRRLSADMRLHDGWTPEDCEHNFRMIVEQTLADSPPNAEVSGGRSRTDKMHPLPWTHQTDGRRISAVIDAEGKVIYNSLICQQLDWTKARQTHAYIVKATTRRATGRKDAP